ncbi:exodeoxyribonuclease III [Cladophialophora carrionii CBS 160.54]|uniref:DNA-(apurinic or apyrimidinic site) endonuclease 2 n=1 Tax=Cladophialophora carrionii CBS 160.54 TaxID=1279043 RepID=V9DJ12_9EURO|nr:exodeoxyribonuclease III [Cladophialophora carrionii CBS 160.54]ETI26859.1 exodeoxyribonuclease III [Cladophialophora carrionii CBS 160.54]
MVLRVTTWNVNGMRTLLEHQPWKSAKTMENMFDILEADIVIFQEAKVQRKDLPDDMVLLDGWESYWSFPKEKKGYSGVVVYTRNAKCTPIRVEEGFTGCLTVPGTSVPYRELAKEQQIGGYPDAAALSDHRYKLESLDSEGRCVLVEFQAFVLIATYFPAERDESRTHYRLNFLQVLEVRIRNLVKMGKRVVLAGDLNISREEIDTAHIGKAMLQPQFDPVEWISTPPRRWLNHLLVGGRIYGPRDTGREPILWDVCRSFHEGRVGMYTCWETRINARPGNYGARIDYIICNHDMKEWFSASNIQEGLMGSDHCPVYADLKDTVVVDGIERHILDLVNPPGMFVRGIRQEARRAEHALPLSGRLLGEFRNRQSIKDMLTRQPVPPKVESSLQVLAPRTTGELPPPAFHKQTMAPRYPQQSPTPDIDSILRQLPPYSPRDRIPRPVDGEPGAAQDDLQLVQTDMPSAPSHDDAWCSGSSCGKRPGTTVGESRPAKRRLGLGQTILKDLGRATSKGPGQKPSKGLRRTSSTKLKDQQTLPDFFSRASLPSEPEAKVKTGPRREDDQGLLSLPLAQRSERDDVMTVATAVDAQAGPTLPQQSATTRIWISNLLNNEDGHVEGKTEVAPKPPAKPTAAETKDSWRKLLAPPVAPLCDHNEPCKKDTVKKPHLNAGRMFWVCARPVGPSGKNESGTVWSCKTFFWHSDWETQSRQTGTRAR